MRLCKAQKNSQFFAAFVKFISNFEHFQKKKNDWPHSLCISEIRDCERSS